MQAHEHATRIWPLLVYAAMHRQTLTYEMLGELIGVPHWGLSNLLHPIQSYCLINTLPGLTVIVVKQDGRPGTGFIAAADVPVEQQRVFTHQWQEVPSPTAEAFLQAVREHPSCGIPEAANIAGVP